MFDKKIEMKMKFCYFTLLAGFNKWVLINEINIVRIMLVADDNSEAPAWAMFDFKTSLPIFEHKVLKSVIWWPNSELTEQKQNFVSEFWVSITSRIVSEES